MQKTKAITRILSLLTALLLLAASLTACSGGVTREETREALDSLLSALDTESYAEAAALYHPNAAMTADLLAAFCEEVKTQVGIDLTEGAGVEAYTNRSSAYYDSNVGGSFCRLTAKIKAGDQTATLTVEVIRNDNGYGIFKVECYP